MKRHWTGHQPATCNLCSQDLIETMFNAYVPEYRSWGFVCKECAPRSYIQLGVGKGQKYEWDKDEQKWELKEGGSHA